jgi:hypothetical protein
VRISLDLIVDDCGISYIDGASDDIELSLSLIRGLCDVLEERVDDGKRILHLELSKESLLK